MPPTRTPGPRTLEEAVKGVTVKWNKQLGANVESGIVVHNLDSGDKVSINGHKNFETASIYKLFVMLAVYYDVSQNNYSLETPIVLTGEAADAEEDGGLIIPLGQSLPVRDLLNAMITNSNNTASLMLLFKVKTSRLPTLINILGFKESDLSDSYDYHATPEDLDQFLSRLANQKLLGPSYDQAMLDLLSRQNIKDRIPALLPPDTKVANKTGDLAGVYNDTGLVFLPNGQRLAITVMVHNIDDMTLAPRFISEISLAAYNFYTLANTP
ncbi:MAG: serine hydrolase [Chloroflexota bacterium]|nr:serine hydrolase [Chloroflexota bacterium]